MSKRNQKPEPEIESEPIAPGTQISLWRQHYGCSPTLAARLLTTWEASVASHDIMWWENGAHAKSAAAGLALNALLALSDTDIRAAVAADAKVKPLEKGEGLAKPKPASKKSTQSRKPTETEKLRHIAEKQASKK